MATGQLLRTLALALPEVTENSHFGRPDFRVREKIFAGLSEPSIGYVKLTPELQAGLIGSRPEAFYAANGAWGLKGWTHLRLDEIASAELKELLSEAWRLVAPKQLQPARAGPAPVAQRGARPTKKRAGRPAAPAQRSVRTTKKRAAPRE
jgi:hypothetical protein